MNKLSNSSNKSSPSEKGISRRSLLKTAGYLSLHFPLVLPIQEALSAIPSEPVHLPGDLQTNRKLSAWIRVNADQTITLLVGKVELGQGVLTAVGQVCAEELDVDISRVRITSGDTRLVPNEGVTAGSFSMPYCATAVQYASAEVRHILLSLAAEKWSLPIESLQVKDGVIASATGKTVSYWDLVLGAALEREATGAIAPKDPSLYRYIGQSMPRIDFPLKMTGQSIFVQELRLPGMLHARVVRPPSYRSKLLSVNLNRVKAMPGVVKVVRNGSFLGVIAKRMSQASAASEVLAKSAKWQTDTQMPTHEGIFDWLLKAPTHSVKAIKSQARAGSETVAQTLQATYQRPFHMHASIGTSCAVATFTNEGEMVIHLHSQSVFETGLSIAKMLGLPPEKVHCKHMQGSGCYGHNMADDVAADAALLAKEVMGSPVRLQYTRAEEHQWEPYGSAMVVKTQANLSESGEILDWDLKLWSNPHQVRPNGDPGNLLSARYLEKPFDLVIPENGGPPNYAADRNAIALYEFKGHKVTTNFITEMPVRASSTRGLGAYANVFSIESFMDEIASKLQVDPVEHRLRYLKDSRARDVLQKVTSLMGPRPAPKTPNTGRGVAFARYKNIATYCAVAMEVQVNPQTGHIRVLKAFVAADAGQLVNPDGVKNQLEGGLIQSLSWTLKEEVKFSETAILSEDWASYPILKFSEVPPVQIELINRPGMPFLGAGEAAQGPSSAALANAVFDAVGVRLRSIPFTPDRVKESMAKSQI
jgi:nicotinate dehydrogenase subunit B